MALFILLMVIFIAMIAMGIKQKNKLLWGIGAILILALAALYIWYIQQPGY